MQNKFETGSVWIRKLSQQVNHVTLLVYMVHQKQFHSGEAYHGFLVRTFISQNPCMFLMKHFKNTQSLINFFILFILIFISKCLIG